MDPLFLYSWRPGTRMVFFWINMAFGSYRCKAAKHDEEWRLELDAS
jgi:hypothetical protein